MECKLSKKLFLTMIIGLSTVICIKAETKIEKVIYYDYTRQSYLVNNSEDLVRYFQSHGFVLKNSPELKDWMTVMIKEKANRSVVIMAMGTAPSEVVESLDKNCTLIKYLKSGGRIIWLGGTPFSNITYPDRDFEVIGKEGIKKVLGIRMAKEGFGRQSNITEEGKKWGMKKPDDDYDAVMKEDITIAFSRVGSKACSWLKNLNSKYPYSGFIRYRSEYDGGKKAYNEDTYRLALFSGGEVIVPEPKEKVSLDMKLSRHSFLRGEEIKIPVSLQNYSGETLECSFLWELKEGKEVLRKGEKKISFSPEEKKDVAVRLNTDILASKGYEMEVSLLRDNQLLTYPRRTGIYIGHPYPAWLPFGLYAVRMRRNSYEIALNLRELRDHNITYISSPLMDTLLMDTLLKYRIKCIPVGDVYYNTQLANSHPETRMILSDGKEVGIITKHELCFNHPLVQKQALRRLREQLGAVKEHPAFSKYFFFDDDVFLYHKRGAISCYCQTCTEKFKKKTGLEPPKSNDRSERYGRSGIIPENDPWLLWMKFRCFDTYGNYHKILEEEKNKIDPEIKMGPVHGLAQFPFFNLASGLYPPSDLGPLSLLSSYFYPSLFRQLKDCIYHSDLAFMGNRKGKELFIVAQAFARNYIVPKEKGTILKGQGESGAAPDWFIRNQFYSWLAGGAKGIIYFSYPALKGPYGLEAYQEMKSLGKIAKRYGPLFKNLERAPKEIAILVSFINNNCFDKPRGGFYRTLLRAHLPVETICDEEIEGGRLSLYKVLVLERINYLTEKIYQRIEKYIKKGGVVIIDRDSELNIPGAILARTPEELIQKVRKVVKPEIAIDSPDIIVRTFKGEGVTYLWLVNYFTDRWVIGSSLYNTLVKPAAITGTLKLSERFYLYDVLKSKELSPEKIDNYKITIEPAGGTLLALYQERIGDIELKYRKEVRRGEKLSLQIKLFGVNSGLQPLEIKIIEPEGRVSEYSTVAVAKKGTLNLEYLLAENDKTGNWKVIVRELSSGKEKEGEFLVK